MNSLSHNLFQFSILTTVHLSPCVSTHFVFVAGLMHNAQQYCWSRRCHSIFLNVTVKVYIVRPVLMATR